MLAIDCKGMLAYLNASLLISNEIPIEIKLVESFLHVENLLFSYLFFVYYESWTVLN